MSASSAEEDPAARDHRRDRTTVRRALAAGAVMWALVGLPLLVAVVAGGGEGRAGVAVVLLGLTLGGAVATAWMLAATLLDLLAGGRPGVHRALWLIGTFLVTALLPVLVAGVGG